MNLFRLLIAEDDKQDLKNCRDAVKRYEHEKQRKVVLVEHENIDDALSGLDNSIDGAIIDLKLEGEGYEGNRVIGRIKDMNLRIPVAILTGTPSAVEHEFTYIGIFTKGEIEYIDLLEDFWKIHDTGLTRIMGGRGLIEKTLNKVFQNNLLPQRNEWTEHGIADSRRTERALLRHTLNHLLQLLENNGEERQYPEEVYLHPPLAEEIRTGSLVKEKNKDRWFAVMNPACDLVVRKNGGTNTDRIIIVEVDPVKVLFPWFPKASLSNNEKGALKTAFQNKGPAHHHWLPKTDFFEGGFLNFRKLSSFEIEEFGEKFETPPEVQISPSFVKDITARFSSYYARQGQPDIDFDKFINP